MISAARRTNARAESRATLARELLRTCIPLTDSMPVSLPAGPCHQLQGTRLR